MQELAHLVSQKRRYFFFVFAVIIYLLIISLLSPIIEAKRASVLAATQTPYVNQSTADGDPDIISNAWSNISNDTSKSVNGMELKALNGAATTADGVKSVSRSVQHSTGGAAIFTANTTALIAISSFHIADDSLVFSGHLLGDGFGIAGDIMNGSFSLGGHVIGGVFGFFSDLTHVSSLIRPTDKTPTPVINILRAQQAAIIESGTKAALTPTATEASLATAVATTGAGGACDDGNGNGGYPMAWCNASMDTIATLSFNDDPINRECTSYADWYFTNVEGHTDFKAYGNAKYWATSSNYPTHPVPVVGAIAVETAGAYGHVAIVQALPGQVYNAQVIPLGYVLVSEMNYDWHGHFRYSYSPLSKFSTYIYP
jgi:hypothetical protein